MDHKCTWNSSAFFHYTVFSFERNPVWKKWIVFFHVCWLEEVNYLRNYIRFSSIDNHCSMISKCFKAWPRILFLYCHLQVSIIGQWKMFQWPSWRKYYYEYEKIHTLVNMNMIDNSVLLGVPLRVHSVRISKMVRPAVLRKKFLWVKRAREMALNYSQVTLIWRT